MSRTGFLVLTALGILLGLAGLVALPHDRYYRFQEHRLAETRKADWIYERLHFDEAPIDVALIGTSRMAGGVSGPRLEHLYCAATGRRVRVANLAIPQFGRNMDFLIVQELLREKAPGLIVMQASEIEGRRPHPGFQTLADARDILAAPLLINLGWAQDLAALPGRQLSLALTTLLDRPRIRRAFDPSAYPGPDLDRTAFITRIDGGVIDRRGAREREALEREAARRARGFSRTYFLPEPLRGLEYRVSRVYLDRVHAMAARARAEVAYAYMPGYGFDGPVPPHILEMLDGHPVLGIHADLVGDHTVWLDGNHPNATGAHRATGTLARHLAALHPALGRPAEGCPAAPAATASGPAAPRPGLASLAPARPEP